MLNSIAMNAKSFNPNHNHTSKGTQIINKPMQKNDKFTPNNLININSIPIIHLNPNPIQTINLHPNLI